MAEEEGICSSLSCSIHASYRIHNLQHWQKLLTTAHLARLTCKLRHSCLRLLRRWIRGDILVSYHLIDLPFFFRDKSLFPAGNISANAAVTLKGVAILSHEIVKHH